jgi:uncharacterized protein YndB with AHSA1/START domain
MIRRLLAAMAVLALTGAARAEVVSAEPNGAVIRETFTVDVPAARVFAAMLEPRRWWNVDHTFSHDVDNLFVDTRNGGCLCERLPGGGHVRHLSVVYFEPGREIRFEGGMGPMQTSGTTGHMAWRVSEAGGHTTVTWTYALGGYFPGGIAAFAPAADAMLGEQTSRLRNYLTSGRP